MKGVIAFADSFRGRYSALTDGGYVIFEVLKGEALEIGDQIVGNLDSLGRAEFATGRDGRLDVLVEDRHCSSAVARRWIADPS